MKKENNEEISGSGRYGERNSVRIMTLIKGNEAGLASVMSTSMVFPELR